MPDERHRHSITTLSFEKFDRNEDYEQPGFATAIIPLHFLYLPFLFFFGMMLFHRGFPIVDLHFFDGHSVIIRQDGSPLPDPKCFGEHRAEIKYKGRVIDPYQQHQVVR